MTTPDRLPIPEPGRLRSARLAARKSQETMARMFGVTHAAYSRWELGHSTPQPDRRERLWTFINLVERKLGGQKT
jgi:transcriptional regulator with XRE-family HTH domain